MPVPGAQPPETIGHLEGESRFAELGSDTQCMAVVLISQVLGTIVGSYPWQRPTVTMVRSY